MIRVLIVDDQEIVRQGLAVILRHQPEMEVVGMAADGLEAVDQVVSVRPDVVLMDLKMPRLNGIHATRRITEQFPAVQVVVLTTYDTDEWVFDAIRAGASGYLLKDSDGSTIIQAIKDAAAGQARLDPLIAHRVLREFNRLTAHPAQRPPADLPVVPVEPPLEALTERELAILQELARGKNNREIADTLFLAEGTVKNYVSTILAKLHANDRTQAALVALRHGLAKLD